MGTRSDYNDELEFHTEEAEEFDEWAEEDDGVDDLYDELFKAEEECEELDPTIDGQWDDADLPAEDDEEDSEDEEN